jgi:hypothetical protein
VYGLKAVKSLTTTVLTLALVSASATATLAHPDNLGEPDPYWQQLAVASAARASRDSASTATGSAADALPIVILVCAAVVLSALSGVSLLRSLWRGDAATSGANDSTRDAWAAAPSAAPFPATPERPVRTVRVLPPSARREMLVALRDAAAILFRKRTA